MRLDPGELKIDWQIIEVREKEREKKRQIDTQKDKETLDGTSNNQTNIFIFSIALIKLDFMFRPTKIIIFFCSFELVDKG